MEYSIWITPDSEIRDVLPTLTGVKNLHFECLRFSTQEGRVLDQGINGQFVNNSSVFELNAGYFGSGGYLQQPDYIKELAQKYTVYMDVSSKGNMIDDMIIHNKQSNTVQAIVQTAKRYGFHGVETNFETLGEIPSSNMPKYVQFLKDLGNALHNAGLKFRYTTMSEIVNGTKTAFVGAWRNGFIKDLPYDEVCMMA